MNPKKLIFKSKIIRDIFRNTSIRRRLKRPYKATIEVTNACNSHCIMCPRQGMTRSIGSMNMELFQKVIQDCDKAGVKIIQLFNFGEPLIHYRLPEMVQYAKTHTRARVQISTNAALLTEKRARELMEAGLDRINIDIDGFTKETYEGIRRRLPFDQVMANTRRLLELRREMGRKLFVSVSIIQMPETEAEIADFRRYWTPLVNRVLVTNYNTWNENSVAPGFMPGQTSGGQAPALQINPTERGTHFTCPCKSLWDQIVILHDGRAAICCLDYDGKVIVGDAKQESLLEIWQGQELTRLRQMHTELRMQDVPPCAVCNQYIFMEGSQWQYMWGDPLSPSVVTRLIG